MGLRNLTKSVICISLVLLVFVANAFANVCNKSQNDSKTVKKLIVRPHFIEIKNHIISVLTDNNVALVFKGEEKPTWSNYNDLKIILQAIPKLQNESLPESVVTNAAEQLLLKNDIANLVNELADLAQRSRQEKEHSGSLFLYQRMFDYHCAYFALAKSINEKLGVKIFPVDLIPKVKSNDELAADGAAIVARLESTADEFIKKNGFENLEAFETFIKEKHPELVEFMEIADTQSIVAMHRPESARFWIPLAGFQNQRITESSRGAYFKDTKIGKSGKIEVNPFGRDATEADLTLIPREEYAKLSARLKPNYAEVRPSMQVTKFKPGRSADHYGSDLWVFKKEVIEKRATWTPADSLGRVDEITKKAKSLDDIFLPWKYRILMANYKPISHTDPYAKEDNQLFIPRNILTDGLKKMKRWDYGRGYYEVQIMGALTIKDVDAFIFKENPPNKELYDLLVSEGIKVWDERTWPAVPYDGSESQ